MDALRRASRAGARLFVLFGFAACHATDATELPSLGTKVVALAMIVKPDSGAFGVYGVDLGDASQRAIVFPTHSDATVYLLAYERNLSELGLEPGWQQLAATSGAGLPLPIADQLFETRFVEDSDSESPWREIPALPESVSESIRLDKPNPCVRFGVKAVPLIGARGNGRVLEVIDDRTVLIGTEQGTYFILQDDEVAPATRVSTTTPGFSGVRANDGDLWVLSADGRVQHGDHIRGFTAAPSLNVPGSEFAWIRASPPGSPFELFATTDSGTLERFDGTQWTLLDRTPPQADYGWRGGLAWIGPRSAIAIGPRFPAVLRYDAGMLSEQHPFVIDSPSEVDFFPEIGIVVGSETGLLVVWNDVARRWERVPGTENYKAPIISMAPLDRGLLFGGQFGGLAQYHPGYGLCIAEPYAPRHITRIKPFGDGFVFFTAEDDHGVVDEVTILRRDR